MQMEAASMSDAIYERAKFFFHALSCLHRVKHVFLVSRFGNGENAPSVDARNCGIGSAGGGGCMMTATNSEIMFAHKNVRSQRDDKNFRAHADARGFLWLNKHRRVGLSAA